MVNMQLLRMSAIQRIKKSERYDDNVLGESFLIGTFETRKIYGCPSASIAVNQSYRKCRINLLRGYNKRGQIKRIIGC